MNARTKRPAITTDIFGSTLTLNFSNGEELAIDITKLSPEITLYAALHGVKQKLIDAAAIACNVETGRSATIDDKYTAVKAVFDRITKPDGTWNKAKAVESEAANGNMLVRALMHMTGEDKTYVEDFLSAKTKEQRAALKKNPKVLAIIEELRGAPKEGHSDDLLRELGVGMVAGVGMWSEASEKVADTPTETNSYDEAVAQLTDEHTAVAKPKRVRKPRAVKSA